MSTDRIIVGLDLGREQDYSALAVGVLDPEPEPTGPPPILFQPAEGGMPFALPRRSGPLEWLRDARERPITACPACGSSQKWARDTTGRWACGCKQYRFGDPWPPVEKEPEPDGRVLRIQHLKRWPLRTPYPRIVADVAAMMRSGEVAGARLLVDGTGVGVAVADLLNASGVKHERVVVTAGVQTNREALYGTVKWSVPKRDLVGAVQVLLQGRRLKIAPKLQHAATLTTELQQFQYKISDLTAHDSYGAWREGQHDDLVFAVALTCWAVTRPRVFVGAY